jgi:hypothetical protein
MSVIKTGGIRTIRRRRLGLFALFRRADKKKDPIDPVNPVQIFLIYNRIYSDFYFFFSDRIYRIYRIGFIFCQFPEETDKTQSPPANIKPRNQKHGF